jgi:hypothetical protein
LTRAQAEAVAARRQVERVAEQPRARGVLAVRVPPRLAQHRVLQRHDAALAVLVVVHQRLRLAEVDRGTADQVAVRDVDAHPSHGRHLDAGDPVFVLQHGVSMLAGSLQRVDAPFRAPTGSAAIAGHPAGIEAELGIALR